MHGNTLEIVIVIAFYANGKWQRQTLWGKWPSGLRHCDRNWNVHRSVQTPLGARPGHP